MIASKQISDININDLQTPSFFISIVFLSFFYLTSNKCHYFNNCTISNSYSIYNDCCIFDNYTIDNDYTTKLIRLIED